MNTTRYPYNLEEVRALNLDPNGCTSLEIQSSEQIYAAACKYLTDVCNCDSSLRMGAQENNDDDEIEDSKQDGCRLVLGLGSFELEFETETIHAIHTVHGKPVGTFSSAVYLQTLVLIVEGTRKKDLLKRFVDKISEWDTKVNKALINIYSYDIDNQYWPKSIVKRKRDMDTVILPASLKLKLIDDVNNFLEKETAKWYAKHGIPYKRSYLLYGPPGTGKTSTIAALASHIDRHVAYLHISDPHMTDSALKKALQRVPKNCVVVLEDVDALFSADRSKLENIPLSFSGLLNALDGIGGKDASIFILTTNHIDRLDPALIRPGRVDMHLQYPSVITDEQIELMFKQFYPEASAAQTAEFVEKVGKFRSDHRNISTATLQQYFIAHRTSDAQEVVAAIEGGMPLPYIKPDLAALMYN
jgi:chaperone BCS1